MSLRACRTASRPATAVLLWLVVILLPACAIAQTNFAVLVSDGAWTWYNDPRALFHNGKLFFGYVRAADSKTALSVFDLATGQRTDLWAAGFTQLDDHDVPGLLAKQDGTLLAAYSRHISDQYFSYRTSNSTNPITPAGWNAEQSIPNSGAGMTYANPFQLSSEGGIIYNFCRNQNFNPTVYTSTNGGTNWSSPQLFIQAGSGGTVRPYVKYSSDSTQRIDFLYTDGHPRDIANSLYHLYYQGGAFYSTDGTFVKNFSSLPILHDSGERGSVIYQYNTATQADPNQWIPSGRAWNWEIASQTNGDPVCVFTVQRDNVTGPNNGTDDRIYYYYARWTGTNWQKRFIAHAGRPLYPAEDDYAGGICVDPVDPNVIYISSNAQDPFNLGDTTNVPLRASERYEIWRGVTSDGGLAFSWTQITSNSISDNLRPYIPRRYGGEQCVLWFRGTYTSYTSYNCSIVGLFSTPVPPSTSASGNWNSDSDGAWSDPSKWSGGIIPDGSGNIADFSALNITADRTVTLDSPRNIGTLRFGDTSGGQNWSVNPSGGSGITLSSPASIVVNQNTATLNVPLAGTAGFSKSGVGTLILGATNPLSGTINVDSDSGSANDGALRVTASGALANAASPITFRNDTGANAVATFQLDGSAGDITVAQDFLITCRNNNTVPTIQSLAGTNTLTGTNYIQVGGTNVIYQAEAGAGLNLAGPIRYIGGFATARTYTFRGSGYLTVSGRILNSTNGAVLSVIQSGSGTLTLSGANTYTGVTIVNGGTLLLNGSVGSGAVTVLSGTLAGAGTIGGPVTVKYGATLSPGASIGSLTINNSLTNSGTLLMDLNKTGATLTNDAITGLNRIVYGGTLQLVLSGEPLVAGDSFKLFNAASYLGSFTNIVPAAPGPGLLWDTTGLANGRFAVMTAPVPRFTSIALSEATVLISGTNGTPNGPYCVLNSTNLALPLTNWTRLLTNTFNESGAFAITNVLTASVLHEFFLIQLP